ncbi:TetR/AcrR family transcriptional regulator, partial [Streptomyces sp. LP11]|nr:TetR/AcrR family transcriptional regulator [Streptomyces sp. LP11]
YIGWIDLLTTLFQEARQAGQLTPDTTPQAAARITVASFYGMQHLSDVLHHRTDLTERWHELRHITLRALLPQH